jgi:hypothetical protein
LIRFCRSSLLPFTRKLLAKTWQIQPTPTPPERKRPSGPRKAKATVLPQRERFERSTTAADSRRVKDPPLAVPASPAAPNPYSAGIVVEPAHRRCYAVGGREGIVLKKSLPWIVFFGVLLLLVFSNSAYVKMFDFVLWPVRFGILAGFSILLVWSRWRHRRDDAASSNAASPDAADHFLSSAVRWFHGDSKRSK